MNLLILCSGYPDLEGKTAGMFFHVRNLYYKENGIELDVISFSAKENYSIEGINVYTYEYYRKKLLKNKYDILICHAPHISHHYKFINKYSYLFKNIVFIFHGNEVFKVNEILSKEYSFKKGNKIFQRWKRNVKDIVKLYLWRKMFERISYKSNFVFVSKWMEKQFYKFVKIDKKIIKGRNHVIYNSIGRQFEVNVYDKSSVKEYDFITIRNNLDGAKYGIDIVNNLAFSNPNYTFLIIGKGEFFEHYKPAPNIDLIQRELSHQEILNYLNKSKCGLLPTLWDSQGLMTCEFASFGIPTITSDIEICHEILDTFENVSYIENENTGFGLIEVFNKLINNSRNITNEKYFSHNTSGKEVNLFREIVS